MFELDFFKDHIDTTTIHEQTPPIEKAIIDSINQDIDERYESVEKTELP